MNDHERRRPSLRRSSSRSVVHRPFVASDKNHERLDRGFAQPRGAAQRHFVLTLEFERQEHSSVPGGGSGVTPPAFKQIGRL
jgi:hypothetical protein